MLNQIANKSVDDRIYLIDGSLEEYPGSQIVGVIGQLVLHHLQIEMLTNNNQLSDDLRKQLAGLRGVGITLVVNGSLTLEDVKKFTAFERFSIKLLLDEQGTMIPGLIPLLGKIGPP